MPKMGNMPCVLSSSPYSTLHRRGLWPPPRGGDGFRRSSSRFLTYRDVLEEHYLLEIESGADVLCTETCGIAADIANDPEDFGQILQDQRDLVAIARNAADTANRPVLVAGVIGSIPPSDGWFEGEFRCEEDQGLGFDDPHWNDMARGLYRLLVARLAAEDIDLVYLEAMHAVHVLRMICEVCDVHNTRKLPIICSGRIFSGGLLVSGARLTDMAHIAKQFPVTALGIKLHHDERLALKALHEIQDAWSGRKILSLSPTKNYPFYSHVDRVSADDLASFNATVVGEGLADFVGGGDSTAFQDTLAVANRLRKLR